jgi:ElaB/YqjD/DUF883 family membrane-anchored ribosome-binding protein
MARHARRGAKQLKHDADHARNGVMNTVHRMGNEDLRETAAGYVSQGLDHVESLELSVEKEIKNHPLRSVMACLGIGFLAGFLYSRR